MGGRLKSTLADCIRPFTKGKAYSRAEECAPRQSKSIVLYTLPEHETIAHMNDVERTVA